MYTTMSCFEAFRNFKQLVMMTVRISALGLVLFHLLTVSLACAYIFYEHIDLSCIVSPRRLCPEGSTKWLF